MRTEGPPELWRVNKYGSIMYCPKKKILTLQLFREGVASISRQSVRHSHLCIEETIDSTWYREGLFGSFYTWSFPELKTMRQQKLTLKALQSLKASTSTDPIEGSSTAKGHVPSSASSCPSPCCWKTTFNLWNHSWALRHWSNLQNMGRV